MSSVLEYRSWELALGLLFQVDVGHARLREATENSEDLAAEPPEVAEPAINLAIRAVGNRTRIDKILKNHVQHYEVARLPAVERNILRLAMAEMLKQPGDSGPIQQAAELAYQFGGTNSAGFVTGVLRAVLEGEQKGPSAEPEGEPRGSAAGTEQNQGQTGRPKAQAPQEAVAAPAPEIKEAVTPPAPPKEETRVQKPGTRRPSGEPKKTRRPSAAPARLQGTVPDSGSSASRPHQQGRSTRSEGGQREARARQRDRSTRANPRDTERGSPRGVDRTRNSTNAPPDHSRSDRQRERPPGPQTQGDRSGLRRSSPAGGQTRGPVRSGSQSRDHGRSDRGSPRKPSGEKNQAGESPRTPPGSRSRSFPSRGRTNHSQYPVEGEEGTS